MKRKSLELWQSTDYRWRELFEAADVISEGATREEQDGSVYYGSTSILLPLFSHGGAVPDQHVSEVTRILNIDPHARIRAVRIACLEAQVRSGAPIGRVKAELFVASDARGVRVNIEIEARVFTELSRGRGQAAVSIAPRRKRTPSER